MDQPATLGKTDFADLLGIAPSTVTVMLRKGLVVADGGNRYDEIRVRESLRNISVGATVRAKLKRTAIALLRDFDAPVEQDITEEKQIDLAPPESVFVASEAQTAAMARKISAQADQEEMKAAQMAGNLIAREDVDAAMRFLGAAVRAAMDVFPDQTAPVVCAVTDLNETHALLTDACRNVLADIGAAIERQQAALTGGAQ